MQTVKSNSNISAVAGDLHRLRERRLVDGVHFLGHSLVAVLRPSRACSGPTDGPTGTQEHATGSKHVQMGPSPDSVQRAERCPVEMGRKWYQRT